MTISALGTEERPSETTITPLARCDLPDGDLGHRPRIHHPDGHLTVSLGAAFACAIILSIVVDVAVQLNVWRVIGVAGRRAHELGNDVLPGVGYLLAALVVVGGLVFNIGNVAGSGLGTDAMLGIEPRLGGALSALIAVGIFLSKRAGVALDRVVIVLGLVMVVATLAIMVTSDPPVGDALTSVVAPETFDFVAVTTIIGGTVGGYITYAGAHRLLDTGTTGTEHVRDITRSSVTGVLLTGLMRIIAVPRDPRRRGRRRDPRHRRPGRERVPGGGRRGRPAGFGLILWAAALTSVIGAAYTSVSFMTSSRTSERTRNLMTVGFIVLSTVIFVAIEEAPVTLLTFAGTFNGLIAADRVRRAALDRLAAARPAPRLPLPALAGRRRHPRLVAHALPGLPGHPRPRLTLTVTSHHA